MNILIYRYNSICEPDVIAALLELGHEVFCIELEMEKKTPSPEEVISNVRDALFARRFDAVFSINYYPVLSSVCDIFKIRYICLTVDSPVVELYSDTIASPWNRIFLFDRLQYQTFHPKNPTRIFHAPLAVNLSRIGDFFSSCTDTPQICPASQIAFVGSLYTEKCPFDSFRSTNAYINGYLDGIMAAQSKIYGSFFIPDLLSDDLVSEFVSSVSDFYIPPELATRDDRMVMALMYLGPKITAMERVRLLTLLGSHYPVDIYTNSNTAGLPVNDCGCANTHTEMPLIFRNSAINLNITAKSIRSGVPLRVFDVLGCGGFLISNYQAELEECFVIGEDLVIYTDEDDLLNKIEYYLAHEKERADIAANGFEKVSRCHSFLQRMKQILDLAFS